jgi:DNA-nicking Smr family endonuclease
LHLKPFKTITTMNIGDRVRLVHGSEEGVITKILDNSLIEVEIEDGFRIPVRRSEIAIVSLEEQARFGSKISTPKTQASTESAPVLAQKGIYTAYTMLNDKNGALYLINNTDFDMPFIIGHEADGRYRALRAGVLTQRNIQKIEEFAVGEFEQWGTFVFQFLFFRPGYDTPREPMIRKIRFRANTFFKNKTTAPLLNREAYLMQLDEALQVQPLQAQEVQQEVLVAPQAKDALPTLDANKIKEAMLQPTKTTTQKVNVAQTIKQPPREIDLHIEALTKDHANMNNAQMLELQVSTFEKALENAIATGMKDIIFIHGVGSGKLRTEIHKRLSGHPDISYFADARKEKFGYGATEVSFK